MAECCFMSVCLSMSEVDVCPNGRMLLYVSVSEVDVCPNGRMLLYVSMSVYG